MSHVIIYGCKMIFYSSNENVFAYTRQLEGKTVVVAGNLTDKQSSLTLPFDIEEDAIKLHNYNSQLDATSLKPFEAFVAEI